jgi:hypothetical protein
MLRREPGAVDLVFARAFHHGHPLQRQYHSLVVRHAQLSVPYEQEKVPTALGAVHALAFFGSKSGQLRQTHTSTAPCSRHAHVAPG